MICFVKYWEFMTNEKQQIMEISAITRNEFLMLLESYEQKMKLPRSQENEEIIREAEIQFCTAIYLRCATDIELFAIMFFSHYCRYEFNAFHRATFSDYVYGERAIRRASCAPRGFAKSTLEALIKPIHDVCYKLEKFIVIISNTEAQAVQKLKDIQTEFITNDFLIRVYGRFIHGRKAGSTDFVASNSEH